MKFSFGIGLTVQNAGFSLVHSWDIERKRCEMGV